jgi:hypothetical protein
MPASLVVTWAVTAPVVEVKASPMPTAMMTVGPRTWATSLLAGEACASKANPTT